MQSAHTPRALRALSTSLTYKTPLRLHTHPLSRTLSTTTPAMTGLQGIIAEAVAASVRAPENRAKYPSSYDAKPHHLKNGAGFTNPWDRSVRFVVGDAPALTAAAAAGRHSVR